MTETTNSQILIYQAEDGSLATEVRLLADTVWLRQEQMSELFGRERSVITKHLRNVFKEGELAADSVCANFAHTAEDEKTYQVRHYNLDVIISVGYRVKSGEGTRFRQWATRILREHLTQGYTINRQRFEANAQELEAALALVRKTAQSRMAVKGNTVRGHHGEAALFAAVAISVSPAHDDAPLTEVASSRPLLAMTGDSKIRRHVRRI